MNCNCIAVVSEKLKETTDDPYAEICQELVMRDGQLDVVVPVLIRYRHKKKDGTLKDRAETDYLVTSFCPFCGKPNKGELIQNKQEKENISDIHETR